MAAPAHLESTKSTLGKVFQGLSVLPWPGSRRRRLALTRCRLYPSLPSRESSSPRGYGAQLNLQPIRAAKTHKARLTISLTRHSFQSSATGEVCETKPRMYALTLATGKANCATAEYGQNLLERRQAEREHLLRHGRPRLWRERRTSMREYLRSWRRETRLRFLLLPESR
jgi:hypothetical protein